MIGILFVMGCDIPPTLPAGTTSTQTSWTSPDPWSCDTLGDDDAPQGGLVVLSGSPPVQIASVVGPGDRCGDEPPLVLSDLGADGVPEVALLCNQPGLQSACRHLHVLDGLALLESRFDQVGFVALRTHGYSALGDLDGDGLVELGFGEQYLPLASTPEMGWWSLLSSQHQTEDTSLEAVGVELTSWTTMYGTGAPHPVPDVDGDGVPDLVVSQQPGADAPTTYLVSGAEAIQPGGLSVPTQALRQYLGLGYDEVLADVVGTGDVDGDGQDDLAIAMVDRHGKYHRNQRPTVLVARGDDLTDPKTTLRIEGSVAGRDRFSLVQALGDLDGDGLPELAVLLTTSSASPHAELAVIPSSILAQRGILDPTPYTLGGVDDQEPRWLEACDLDGDGLSELVLDIGTWDGRDLMSPGTLPIGPGAAFATCAGDLDGVAGEELLVGQATL